MLMLIFICSQMVFLHFILYDNRQNMRMQRVLMTYKVTRFSAMLLMLLSDGTFQHVTVKPIVLLG